MVSDRRVVSRIVIEFTDGTHEEFIPPEWVDTVEVNLTLHYRQHYYNYLGMKGGE